VEPAPPARRVVLEYVEDLFQHAMLLLIAYRSIGCRAQAKVPPPVACANLAGTLEQ